jgi:menaquinone-specific isochorismate synthase
MTPPGLAWAGARSEERVPTVDRIGQSTSQARRAISVALEDIEAVEPGRLVSVSVPLPAGTCPDISAMDGDTRWQSAGVSRLGRGRVVVEVASGRQSGAAVAARLEGERRAWRRIGGTEAALPTAFFTHSFPSADGTAETMLWIPRLLVEQAAGQTVITLTARRDPQVPPIAVAKNWLADFEHLLHPVSPAVEIAPRTAIERIAEEPDRRQWMERVVATTQAIAAGRFDKAVLARRITVALPRPASPARIVQQLWLRYPDCNVFSLPHGSGAVIVASPERVAVKDGRTIVSHALAGTTSRHARPEIDADLANQLLGCAKEREEHGFVVDAIVATLRQLCDSVDWPKAPTTMRLRHLQHLWTPVSGRLRPGVGLLEAVDALHPTPAVAGYPRQAAVAWLGEIGEHRDQCYTGVAGWIDSEGDGEAAVILRTAMVEGSVATLWAGAGIVAQSRPEDELVEIEMKLSALLEVLAQA